MLKVNAYCVGGSTGILAYFEHPTMPNWICIAKGDDGHWSLSDIIDKYWIKYIIKELEKITAV